MIHATRSFLLNDFTDLGRRPSIPHPTVTGHIRKCIAAAEDVMTLVDGLGKQGVLIQSFWFTHYVCFCAITVVYIYTIQQYRLSSSLQASSDVVEDTDRLRFLFTLGESCQQHLAEATRKNCPSRRYSIILEELRLEVHRQIGAPLSLDQSGNSSEGILDSSLGNQDTSMGQRAADMSSIGLPGSLNAESMGYTDGLQADALLGTQFAPDEEFGLLDNLDGSIWWTQLDSWVSRINFSADMQPADDLYRPFPTFRMILPTRPYRAIVKYWVTSEDTLPRTLHRN